MKFVVADYSSHESRYVCYFFAPTVSEELQTVAQAHLVTALGKALIDQSVCAPGDFNLIILFTFWKFRTSETVR